MAGCCCAEAFTAAVLIGVMRLLRCPFDSAWYFVCEVCRLTVDWVDCKCLLSFVFLGGARRLELSPCNTRGGIAKVFWNDMATCRDLVTTVWRLDRTLPCAVCVRHPRTISAPALAHLRLSAWSCVRSRLRWCFPRPCCQRRVLFYACPPLCVWVLWLMPVWLSCLGLA